MAKVNSLRKAFKAAKNSAYNVIGGSVEVLDKAIDLTRRGANLALDEADLLLKELEMEREIKQKIIEKKLSSQVYLDYKEKQIKAEMLENLLAEVDDPDVFKQLKDELLK